MRRRNRRRLERLTTDFLAYARPRSPQKTASSLDNTLGYVADACRPRAIERGVSILAQPSGGLMAEIDAGYVQQALVDLVINAVEASPATGKVELRAAPAVMERFRLTLRTPAQVSRRHRWPGSLSPSLRPSRRERDWAWPLPATLPAPTVATWPFQRTRWACLFTLTFPAAGAGLKSFLIEAQGWRA